MKKFFRIVLYIVIVGALYFAINSVRQSIKWPPDRVDTGTALVDEGYTPTGIVEVSGSGGAVGVGGSGSAAGDFFGGQPPETLKLHIIDGTPGNGGCAIDDCVMVHGYAYQIIQ